MLHDLKELMGSPVMASDGEMGKVRNFLFDDRSWKVCYLVVDVEARHKRREVVLPIAAIDPPDWTQPVFNVHLTQEQVRESPDVDAHKPVTRQQEIAMEEYWGKLIYWLHTKLEWGALIPEGRKYPVRTKEDPDLRSALDLTGYQVWATDGEVGRLEGFILDEASWHLGYLDVKAGDWLLGRSVLIPTRWVKSVSWADFRVKLHHGKSGI